MSQNVEVGTIHWNLSADALHMWATQYYECKQNLRYSGRISPVSYFLLCRSIELELKSRHLKKSKTLEQVKEEFGHNLIESYEALEQADKLLNANEKGVLRKANTIYAKKGFEYCVLKDVVKGYSRYPELEKLDFIAKKLLGVAT